MKETVLYNQSLFDVAVQHTGTLESVFEMALLNNASITDELVAGNRLLINVENHNTDIKDYYKINVLQPSSALTDMDKNQIERDYGIGSMTIGSTFIIR